MTKLITQFSVALIAVLVFFFGMIPFASANLVETGLRVVPNEKVCMVTDMYFGKTQIPVKHGKKTYYGCCENCKKTLSQDAKSRTAVDPVSGKSVDKASAVIAALADGSVLYFESQKTFEQYSKKASPQ